MKRPLNQPFVNAALQKCFHRRLDYRALVKA
jgi:hypothetical protein